MMCTRTVEVWIPVFDYGRCTREFGFAVIGHPDKRRASIRRQVEALAKDAAKTIVSQYGVQVLETVDCGVLGYDSENYLGVRVRVNAAIPADVMEYAESLKHLPQEALREQVQRLYEAGDKQHTRRLDICATLLGDWFVDGYCLSWSAIYRQLGIQIRGLGRAYISQSEFLSLTRDDDTRIQQPRRSFLQRFKALFPEW